MYNMSTDFDVIIPVSEKDILIVKRNIIYIGKNINPSCIYLIMNKAFHHYYSMKFCVKNKVVVLDESQLIEGLNYSHVALLKGSSAGWYLQQFIKMGFSLSKYAKRYYLIWDADTIPLRPISFFNETSLFFTPKTEYYEPYFVTIKKLLGLSKLVDYSFIAENMLIDSNIMRDLIETISKSDVFGESWYDKVLNATNDGGDFSEFETYGTFVMAKYPGTYRKRTLNTFREAGYIDGRCLKDRLMHKMAKDYDTISLELYHKPLFPRNILCIALRCWVLVLAKSLLLIQKLES